MRGFSQRAWALLSLGLLAGCPRGIYVGLGEPASVQNLTFVVGNHSTPRGRLENVNRLAVQSCGGESRDMYWKIEREAGSPSDGPMLITYGEADDGWFTTVAVTSLIPGCYSVSVSGTHGVLGGLSFTVDSVGRIRRR